jgi:hypothetical protein
MENWYKVKAELKSEILDLAAACSLLPAPCSLLPVTKICGFRYLFMNVNVE